jgi:hypothetical protein
MIGLLKIYDMRLTQCESYNKCKLIFEEKIDLIKSIELLTANLNNLSKLLNQMKQSARFHMRYELGKNYKMIGQSPRIRI